MVPCFSKENVELFMFVADNVGNGACCAFDIFNFGECSDGSLQDRVDFLIVLIISEIG